MALLISFLRFMLRPTTRNGRALRRDVLKRMKVRP